MGIHTTPSTTSSSTSTSTATTSASASTISTTTTSTSSSNKAPFQLLEITLISAQDLAPVSKSMRTYAIAWVRPDRKLNTRVDNHGHSNPTWNDKFVFRVDNEFLTSDASAVTVEIYTVSWFRNNLVGTVRVLITDLIPKAQSQIGTRFVALQVRRGSGTPQGILNMGVSLINSSQRSMPFGSDLTRSANVYSDPSGKKSHKEGRKNHQNDEKQRLSAQIQLWRSRSERTELNFEDLPPKSGSICNGSAVNGSEQNSDVGPSASVVAAAIAKGLYPLPATTEKREADAEHAEVGGSIVEDLTIEEAKAKGYKAKAERWRMELPLTDDVSDKVETENSRRHSDGGLFSCFAYGFEFTIVCGASNKSDNDNSNRSKKNGEKSIKCSPCRQKINK